MQLTISDVQLFFTVFSCPGSSIPTLGLRHWVSATLEFGQKGKKTKIQKYKNTKIQKYKKTTTKKPMDQQTKRQKREFWCQGRFAGLQCFFLMCVFKVKVYLGCRSRYQTGPRPILMQHITTVCGYCTIATQILQCIDTKLWLLSQGGALKRQDKRGFPELFSHIFGIPPINAPSK